MMKCSYFFAEWTDYRICWQTELCNHSIFMSCFRKLWIWIFPKHFFRVYQWCVTKF